MSDKTALRLSELARPVDDDDWGSEDQIRRESEFFDYMQSKYPQAYESLVNDPWYLKMTTDDLIDNMLIYSGLIVVKNGVVHVGRGSPSLH